MSVHATRPGAALSAGARVGGYRVVGPLCDGGMGQLYEVIDVGLERAGVLKVLHGKHGARADLGERLRQEARLLVELQGARVPMVYATGALDDGRPYFVMELLGGCDLRAELRRLGVMSVPTSARLLVDVLETVVTLHERGIVHRDLKLENLFLGEAGRVFVLDFGVARHRSRSLDLTTTGVALGTLRTMAPEQHLACEVDERCDVYGAGLALYELLTGRGPFDHLARTAQAMRAAHCSTAPAPPSAVAPHSVPPAFDRIALRALAKRPRDRFGTALAMLHAVREASWSLGADEGPTFIDPEVWEGAA